MATSLYIANSLGAAAESVLVPWCKQSSREAVNRRGLAAILTPSPCHASFIRACLLENKVSMLGVRFLTPQRLRELLMRQVGPRLPLREHLRLLLSIAAHECMQLPPNAEARAKRMREPDYLAAKSVARAPDHFLRLIDQFSAAGVDLVSEGPTILRAVMEKFYRHLRACTFDLIYDADRQALKTSANRPVQFSNLLVAGFNAARWPLWFLLRAAVQSSENATILLDYPHEQSRKC
jgi:hypothetical protein